MMMIFALCGISQAQDQAKAQQLPGYKTTFEANPFWHNWFVSANLGANAFFGEYSSEADFKNTITFMPQIAVGKMFTPWWGVRLQGGGGALHGFNNDATQMLHMHYMYVNADVMLGLLNFFGKYKEDRVFDIVPFFGVGGMTRSSQQSFILHGGVQGKFRLCERFDANVEFQGMIFNDKMVTTGGFPNDGLGGLTVGVTYYFKGRGFRTAPKLAELDELKNKNAELTSMVQQLQNRPPRVEVVEKEVVKTVEKISSVPTTIPFKFNSAVVDNIYEPMLFNIATFMKNNPETKVRIVGFADKFGPVNFNLQISKRRAEAIAKILNKEYGIENDRILVEGAGKEKPYYEKNNKWNRCAVVEVIR